MTATMRTANLVYVFISALLILTSFELGILCLQYSARPHRMRLRMYVGIFERQQETEALSLSSACYVNCDVTPCNPFQAFVSRSSLPLFASYGVRRVRSKGMLTA